MRTSNALRPAAMILLLASHAAVGGELRPVACDPDLAAFPPLLFAAEMKGREASAAEGLGPKVRAGKLALAWARRNEAVMIRAAIDYSKSDLPGPDLLLLDLAGEGRFDKRRAIRLRPGRASKPIEYLAECGPVSVEMVRDGESLPLMLRGMVARVGTEFQVAVFIAPAVQGQCRFGREVHAVRLIDGTGDFRFDAKGSFDSKKPAGMGMGTGDTLLVDTADGTFARSMIRAYYGQPVYVGGGWYNVTISPDGTSVAASPLNISGGQVRIDADRWELALERDGKLSLLTGSRAPVAAPAGTYRLIYCRRWSDPDEKGRRAWLLAANRGAISGKDNAKPITISPETPCKLPIGSPLKTELKATAAGRNVTFSLDAPSLQPGLSVVIVTGFGGQMTSKPDPPTVRMTDPTGKVVHELALEYG